MRLGISSQLRDPGSQIHQAEGAVSLGLTLASTVAVWWLLSVLSPLPNPLVLGPYEVAERLADDLELRTTLVHALGETLPIALASLVAGLTLSTVWAIASHMYPTIGQVFTSALLVTQAVPLLALAPLFVLIFGRDSTTTILIASLAVAFPGYSVIYQRLQTLPKPAIDLANLYGKSKFQRLRRLEIPWAAYSVFTALRIAAPRVLLGVMLAEQLATGKGLGFWMVMARGRLEFHEMWTAIAVTAVIALTLYYVSNALAEHFARTST